MHCAALLPIGQKSPNEVKHHFFAFYHFRVNFGLFQSTDRVGGGEERDR